MGEKRGTKALETWCKRVTQGYPGVKVENMTTSWRDGMAFCAMIHHFRPDLIDFSSLDKSDILRNNEMAFRIAERHLGIPALLDAEDMAEYPVPDRLSILTYLSQFYQAFASNSASPIKKQSSESPDTSLTSLSPSKVQHTPKMEGAPPWKEPCVVCDHAVFIAQRLRIDGKLYHRTCFRCARCKTQLSPADYYETHDGQFCCETCPDEDKMETPIDPTVADDTRPPDDSPKSLVAMRKIMFDSYKDTDDAKLCDIVNLDVQNEISIDDSSSELNNSIVNNVVDKIKDPPECVEFTDTSRRNSLEKSNLDDNSVNLETTVHTVCDLKPIQAINPEIVINDTKMVETRPESPIEATNPEIVISDTKMVETRPESPIEAINPEIVINDTKMVETRPKNPFEDDDEEEDEKLETSKTSTNPFGSDSEDEAEIKSSTPNKTTPIKHVPSSNPFESDEDEESKPPKPLPRRSAQPSPQPFPRNKFRGSQMSLTSMSSMGSYTSPRKKKPAPPPPASPYNTLTTPRSRKAKKAPLPPSLTSSRLSLDSDVSTKTEDEGEPDKVLRGEEIALEISNIAEQISIMVDAHNESKIPQESIDESIKSMETPEVSESVESNFELQKKTIPQTPPPKPRRLEVSSEISTRSESPTPSASTSNIDSLNYQDELTSPTEKETKDSANMNKKISEEKGSYTMPKSTYGQWRRKKAPAPPLPLPKRRNVRPMPIENIKQELYDIEIKQQGLERQGVTLENKIRDKFDTETSISPYVEELVLQLFELVNEKNELFRKQAELMYLRRQHHLEEEHAELEYQIRCLMARPENNKTDSDKETEEQLIQRLVEVVERRDAIVQCLEMDRLREAEEDKSINSSLGIFTQNLSDSQPKSSKKHKKKKDKRNSLKSLDLDKDLDESEKEVKKKKKWYSTLQHLKNKRL